MTPSRRGAGNGRGRGFPDAVKSESVSPLARTSSRRHTASESPNEPTAIDRRDRRQTGESPGSHGGKQREANRSQDGSSQHEVAQLKAEIKRLQQEAESKDRQVREATLRAHEADEELERAKLRIEKEAHRKIQKSERTVVLPFLDVLDDLDRALAAAHDAAVQDVAEDNSLDNPLIRGVELVRKSFNAKLARFDIAHAPSLGMAFDPGRHNALSMVPVAEPEKDGLIIAVIREGYTIGDEILRPASVAVGKYSG